MSKVDEVLSLMAEENVQFVDLRFTDLKGKEHHLSFPAADVDEDFFEDGKPFDGSSIAAWKSIDSSDMLLKPDATTARLDPFREHKTLVFTCDVVEPDTGAGYARDPRSIARRAENYLKSTGMADAAYFGPEPEFYVFDGVVFGTQPENPFFKVYSDESAWSSRIDEPSNHGHRPGHQGGYLPVPPADSFADFRAQACLYLKEQGVPVEIHHHEVGTGQCEIGTRFSTLVNRADWTQILKYTLWNTALEYGKTVTFMPKPVRGMAGNGMHVNQSLWKDGKNLFVGNGYAGLSDTALYYIGGIIAHAKALNAITNPTTNSYKRLVPGFEAPVKLAYSACNRSASIRIPHAVSPKAIRVEVRFPDPMANSYLAFSAMLMAGLDGIANKIHPGEAADKNLYDLPPEENRKIATISASLNEALRALEADHAFLTQGGVFGEDMLAAYVAMKDEEVRRLREEVSPAEYDMYFKL